MPASDGRDSLTIGLAPLQWVWLFVNLLWVHSLVPGIILRLVTFFRDPATGVLERVGLAVVLVAGIPFVAVVGFGMVSWGTLERLAGLRRRGATID